MSSQIKNKLEVLKYDDKNKVFTVKSPKTGNVCKLDDTFAEMFPLWVGRILITAKNKKWALTAANVATGFATSVIMAPAEAAIERFVPPEQTPDNRLGVLIQIYNRNRFELKNQLIQRIGQCIMTCPTTAAFNGLDDTKRKLKVGRSLRYFGDGFEKKAVVGDRKCWKIPVMEGNFIVENRFGAKQGVAGGNILILAKDQQTGLKAAELAADAINNNTTDTIMPFPGGICRAGSKAGSLNYKLKASTYHTYCPSLKTIVEDTHIPEEVNSVYEIVMNGLTLEAVNNSMCYAVQAAASTTGVVKISAGNYGGKLGPYKAFLKDALNNQ